MIEIYHFKDRAGNKKVAVFGSYSNSLTDGQWVVKEYKDRYHTGLEKPHYPLPAIPLQVAWPDPTNSVGYADMIYIDDVTDPDDPVMVCAWDFWDGSDGHGCIGKTGEYTRTIP